MNRGILIQNTGINRGTSPTNTGINRRGSAVNTGFYTERKIQTSVHTCTSFIQGQNKGWGESFRYVQEKPSPHGNLGYTRGETTRYRGFFV
jgi:hypothetical protein